MKFTSPVKEALLYYVYCLVDPRSGKIFYIGKGYGDRVFQHAENSLNGEQSSLKLDTIREIIKEGREVQHYIIRHGLDEASAFMIESTLIDLLTYGPFNTETLLTNIQSGHHQWDKGIKTIDEIFEIYDCQPITMNKHDKVIFININKSYKGDSVDERYLRPSLYEATRKYWKLNPNRANQADYILAVYRGIVRGVFKPISDWYPSKVSIGRYEVDAKQIWKSPYLHKSVTCLFKQGQNPIHYHNC